MFVLGNVVVPEPGNQEGGFAKRHPELMTQTMTHANNHYEDRRNL